MSEDKISQNLQNELAMQLKWLVKALRSTCHRPGCKNTYCPEQCDCRLRTNGKIKRLNLHTALVWELAKEIHDVLICIEGWRGDDRQYIKTRLFTLSVTTEVLYAASAHHDRDERVRYIFSAVNSQINTLRKKLVSGRYDYNEKQWLYDRNARIRQMNLREVV